MMTKRYASQSTSPEKGSTESLQVRSRLVASAGRLAQDFGFNRVAGEVLLCLYLSPAEVSLDDLETELHLSKAAVSLASTQLERLGLIQRVRRPGDRKRYYRSADAIGSALRNGIMTFTRAKLTALSLELDQASVDLTASKTETETAFMMERVKRLQLLNHRANQLMSNPLLKLFAKLGSA